jgi:DNA replication and repair protein RecF
MDVLADATRKMLEELGIGEFQVVLETSVEPDADQLAAALSRSLGRDRARGHTSVGPHTDDIGLSRKQGRAREIASRGEARAIAVGLRLAEREVLAERTGTVPLLLLDDVAAELDEARTRKALEIIRRRPGQVIGAAARDVLGVLSRGWRHLEVRNGAVVSTSNC